MSSSLNRVILIGHLGQDPKLSYTQSGQAVANLRMATSERFKDKDGQWTDRTEWHSVVVWGKPAEFCGQYLAKGALVAVEGKLQTRKWQDKDGQDRYSTEVVAQSVQGLSKSERGQGSQSQGRDASAPTQYSDDDLGPAFPAESKGMDDVPF